MSASKVKWSAAESLFLIQTHENLNIKGLLGDRFPFSGQGANQTCAKIDKYRTRKTNAYCDVTFAYVTKLFQLNMLLHGNTRCYQFRSI